MKKHQVVYTILKPTVHAPSMVEVAENGESKREYKEARIKSAARWRLWAIFFLSYFILFYFIFFLKQKTKSPENTATIEREREG